MKTDGEKENVEDTEDRGKKISSLHLYRWLESCVNYRRK